MGLFSGIKKFAKKIVNGIKKVFAPILTPIAKFLNSKIGKIILIAAAVFTVGIALYAGWAAAAATQGTMMTKFLTGAKAFVSAVMNPIQAAKAAVGGTGIFASGANLTSAGQVGVFSGNAFTEGFGQAAVSTAADSAAAGELLAEGGAEVAAEAGMAVDPAAAVEAGASTGAEAAVGMGPPAGGAGTVSGGASAPQTELFKQIPGGGDGSFLSNSANMIAKAAGKFGDFTKTTGGGLLMSNVLQGYSQGKIEEREEERRAAREALWADSPELDHLREVSQRRMRVPDNWNGGVDSRIWQIRNNPQLPPTMQYSGA